jgi:dienelactone hydrolase/pimeloyl-ACP methyl ester carboxylesterase
MLSRRDMLALSAATALPPWLDPRLAWAIADDDPTRVFTGDRKPTDARLGAPKTLNDYFPFIVPKTKEAWETRRKQLREQVLVATGLWPMPEKKPLNATIHGKIDRDGYTIEKVFFASMPGHYVCGNLYRPVVDSDKPPKHPGVLFAHGHWAGGRLHDDGEKAAAASVKSGGEPDLERGRYFMQALPATLAKLGFVVFHYDMIGYSDSTAIPHREGFKDAEAELRLQSFMGLQTWNSVRALDFLSSLPDVNPKKLGMTGASGGGTQTFMLAAIDDRLACAFPAVMVSTGMQGGCVCENCSLLRVNTGNVEIAGLFAPKPMACSAANDWTKEMMTKGYPELQELYDLYGAKDKVAVRAWLEYGHQYNVHARQMMYSWFLKHLAGKDEEVKEPPFKPVVPVKELSVFDDGHPRPKDELKAPQLREAMTKASDEQHAKLAPKDAASLKEFKRVVGTALRVMVNSTLPSAIAVRMGPLESKLDGVTAHRAVLGRTDERDAVPTCGAFGSKFRGSKAIVWLHPQGKASLFVNGKPSTALTALTDAGFAVVAPDVLGTGENALPKPMPVDKGFAGYTYGYNRSLLANRVHDALTMIAFGMSMLKAKTIHLVGWGEMGVVAVLAKALAGDAVTKTAADLNQFRFENVNDTADSMMLPGAVKYGGLPGFLALCAPAEVLVHNHRGTSSGKLSKAAYEAAGAADKLTRVNEKLDDRKVVEWLVK